MITKSQKQPRIFYIEIILLITTISIAILLSYSPKEPIKVHAISIEKDHNNIPLDSFTKYINLLGVNKETLISALNENPSSIDEGGLEFKEAKIRVWFDMKNYTIVNQVLIMRKDINLNGVKIGAKLSEFKRIFGVPISNKNGDAHFKYKGVFLSVNYDIDTSKTFEVYILKNNF